MGRHKSAFEGEIEAIKLAVTQLSLRQESFHNAVILSDSKAALESIISLRTPVSKAVGTCIHVISILLSNNKTIVLQWIPGHCGILRNERAYELAKKRNNYRINNTAGSTLQQQKDSLEKNPAISPPERFNYKDIRENMEKYHNADP